MATASLGGLVAFAFSSAAKGGIAGLQFGQMPPAGTSDRAFALWSAASNAGFSAIAWVASGLSLAAALVSWLTLDDQKPMPSPKASELG